MFENRRVVILVIAFLMYFECLLASASWMHFFSLSLNVRSPSPLSRKFWIPSGLLRPPCQNQILGWWLGAPDWRYFKLIHWANVSVRFRLDFKSEFPLSCLSRYVSSFKPQPLVIQSSYFHPPLQGLWEQGAGNNPPDLCFKIWGWCNIHYITVNVLPVILVWSGAGGHQLSFTYHFVNLFQSCLDCFEPILTLPHPLQVIHI